MSSVKQQKDMIGKHKHFSFRYSKEVFLFQSISEKKLVQSSPKFYFG